MIGGIKGCIDQDCEKKQQDFIHQHKETIDSLKIEIHQLNSEFTVKKSKNDDLIKGMTPFIDMIENIDKCLAKKEYLEKLIAYAPQKTDEGEMKIYDKLCNFLFIFK